jgi:two-component system, chemotaxis family, response regulator Rcp1
MADSILKPLEVLMVEDSASDVLMTREALAMAKLRVNLHVVEDGVQALQFLRKAGPYEDVPRPGLILLDLNLPRKNGSEVLAEIKQDERLKEIPVVILTTSRSEEDIIRSYKLHANCYITKPVNFTSFAEVIKSIEHFWFSVVTLPPDTENSDEK